MSKDGVLFHGPFDYNDWNWLGHAGQDTLRAAASLGEHNYDPRYVQEFRGQAYYVLPAEFVRGRCTNLHHPDEPLPMSALRRRLRNLYYGGTNVALPRRGDQAWVSVNALDWCRQRFSDKKAGDHQ